MRLGILSDSHDHLGNLKRAADIFRAEGVTLLVHCGDLTRPGAAALLSGFQVIYVLGNMDRDAAAIQRALKAQDERNVVLPVYTGRVGETMIAATHGHLPGKLEGLVSSGRYAYVFHGHTHQRRDELVGRTRIINPGALGDTRHEARSICLLDLATGLADFRTIANW